MKNEIQKPIALTIIEEKIPDELKQIPHWVNWKYLRKEKGGWTKPPYKPDGYHASHTNQQTWTNYKNVSKAYCSGKFDGIGFVLTKESEIIGIDLDKCRNPKTGETEHWATEKIKLINSYTEVSPSGTGFRILCKGKLPPEGRKNGKIEIYDSKRYVTITGHHIKGTSSTIEDRTQEVLIFHSEVFVKNKINSKALLPKSSEIQLVDDEIIRIAKNSKKGDKFQRLWRGDLSGYNSQSEADLSLCNILAFYSRGDSIMIDRLFKKSGLYRPKWDESHSSSGETYGRHTINKALHNKTKFYKPQNKKSTTKTKSQKNLGSLITDVENAERFVHMHGKNVKYCRRWDKWFIWDGQRWSEDDIDRIIALGQEVARTIFDEAKKADPEHIKILAQWATKSLMADRIYAMLKMTKPKLVVRPGNFDQNTWLFNCLNGTVDLKEGKLLPHRRENLITKLAPVNYDPDAKCPKFSQFLNEIFNNNINIIDFLQALFGYCMTGETSSDIFPIFWGSGANGKSTLMGTIQAILGEYSKTAARDLFLNKKDDTHPTGLADLVGSRMVITVETDENKRLAESLIKQLSGGDRIKARFMRQDFFEFEPTFKMILITNHKPIIYGTDYAIWRRIALIPFTFQIPPEKQNEELRSYKFRDEWPGILNWLIEGCSMWRKTGLLKPHEIKVATEQYKSESDIIGDWLTERTETGKGIEEISKLLFDDYSNFCEQIGDKPISNIAFGRKLAEKGFDTKRTGRNRYWTGIKLKNEHKNGDG